MNWPDYVVLAETLVSERFEASKRSAVSRAYYGTLNACRCWLESNGASINKHRIHAEVWGTLSAGSYASARTAVGGKLIADLGNELRALRNQADYDDTFPDLDQQAIGAVSTAKEVLGALALLEPQS